jgi:hypothetical protein
MLYYLTRLKRVGKENTPAYLNSYSKKEKNRVIKLTPVVKETNELEHLLQVRFSSLVEFFQVSPKGRLLDLPANIKEG